MFDMVRVKRFSSTPIKGLLLLVPVSILVSGCSGAPASETSSEYVEPAWMAEYRAEVEEYSKSMQNCIESQGVVFVKGTSGIAIAKAHPGATAAEEEAAGAVLEDCAAKYDNISFHNTPAPEAYQHMLDTHACIINEGYELNQVPSEEIWVEEYKTDGDYYTPYFDLLYSFENSGESLSQDEMVALIAACPTSGWAPELMLAP